MNVTFADEHYSNTAAEAFYDRALDALAAVPGVTHVAAAQTTPFAPSQSAHLALPGADRLPLDVGEYPTYYTVAPRYFEVTGMRIVRGRAFSAADRVGAPPVMIVEAGLAAKFWPGQDPLGKCVIVGAAADAPCRDVVGVASNTRRFVGTAEGALRFYVPMAQRVDPMPPQALLVRVAGDPTAAVAAIRSALLGVTANLPHVQVRLLRELAEPETHPWRLGSTLFVGFGAAALLVASTGVYALLSVMVTQRSREIGVRLALGASPSRTLRMIVGQSVGWAALGLACGLGVALVAARFIEPLLFETSPYDIVVFAATGAVLMAVAVAASLAPAVRASRVDPNVALRAE